MNRIQFASKPISVVIMTVKVMSVCLFLTKAECETACKSVCNMSHCCRSPQRTLQSSSRRLGISAWWTRISDLLELNKGDPQRLGTPIKWAHVLHIGILWTVLSGEEPTTVSQLEASFMAPAHEIDEEMTLDFCAAPKQSFKSVAQTKGGCCSCTKLTLNKPKVTVTCWAGQPHSGVCN